MVDAFDDVLYGISENKYQQTELKEKRYWTITEMCNMHVCNDFVSNAKLLLGLTCRYRVS